MDKPTVFDPAPINDALAILPPTTMSYEAFCEAAVACVAELGPDFICLPSSQHWPANSRSGAVACNDHRVQVWKSSGTETSLGTNVACVGGTTSTAEQCLIKLGRKVAGLKAELAYDSRL